MKVRLHQVDAFADRPFRGNAAAVVLLPTFPAPEWMQAVADENHLAETAFVVRLSEPGRYALRWFTPRVEIDLCGHATLAAAWVLRERYAETADTISFETRSGELRVRGRDDGRLELDLPARRPAALDESPLGDVLGRTPHVVFDSGTKYLAVFEREEDVATVSPDFRGIARLPRQGVIATAPGTSCDFVSRYFAPAVGVDEDPVTGSAHCVLVPFWAERLDRTELHARQISRRGGELLCRIAGDRVFLAGHVAPYLDGEIEGPS